MDFFLMLPYSLSFLIGISPNGVTSMLTLLEYLNFVVFLLFGIIVLFQLPVLIFSLISTGLLKPNLIESHRREIYIILMIIIAIVTPPDVFTFFILGVPVFVLFELSIILAKLFLWRKKTDSKSI
jgi:sec-independent protein translocase protein TatC